MSARATVGAASSVPAFGVAVICATLESPASAAPFTAPGAAPDGDWHASAPPTIASAQPRDTRAHVAETRPARSRAWLTANGLVCVPLAPDIDRRFMSPSRKTSSIGHTTSHTTCRFVGRQRRASADGPLPGAVPSKDSASRRGLPPSLVEHLGDAFGVALETLAATRLFWGLGALSEPAVACFLRGRGAAGRARPARCAVRLLLPDRRDYRHALVRAPRLALGHRVAANRVCVGRLGRLASRIPQRLGPHRYALAIRRHHLQRLAAERVVGRWGARRVEGLEVGGGSDDLLLGLTLGDVACSGAIDPLRARANDASTAASAMPSRNDRA